MSIVRTDINLHLRENGMTAFEGTYLALVVAAFLVFGTTLYTVSWLCRR